jgi:O-antigen/teichoic acid export membrane protein
VSKRKLASNFCLRFGVTCVEKVAGVILLPLLVARLGVKSYGYYALVMSLALLYGSVLTLRLPLAVIRFYPERRERAGPVVLLGLIYWALVALGTMTAFVLFREPIAAYAFGRPGMTKLLGASIALGLAAMLYEFTTVTLRAENRFRFLSLIDSSERILYVAIIAVVAWLGFASVEAVCAILLIMTTAKLLAAVSHAVKGLRWSLPDRDLAAKMFLFSLPYLPFLASTWLVEQSSFFYIQRIAGPVAVGTFAVAYSFAGVLASAMGPLQTVLYPLVRKAYDSGDHAQGKELLTMTLRIILFIGVFGTVSLAIGVDHIFHLLAIRSAVPDRFLLIGLSTGITLTLIRHVFVTIANLEMNTRILAWTTPLVAVASVPAYLVLIRSFGVDGAALAFVLAALVQTVVLGWHVPQSLLPVPTRHYFFSLVLSVSVAGVVQWFFALFGVGSYLIGLLLSSMLLVVVAYWSGGLTGEEKATLSRFIQIPVLRGFLRVTKETT